MADSEHRFCPRCGTALVAGMPFCPRCGLNVADVGDQPASPESPGFPPVDALGRSLDAAPSATPPAEAPNAARSRSANPPPLAGVRKRVDRASLGTAIVFSALVIAAGLVMFGLLTRPQAAGSPTAAPQGGSAGPGGQVGPGASPVGPAAPITGLTIESPRDGQAVATKDVTVIGLGPPGLTVTRDVSFGFDQHATADGTGHWAISVGLEEGENNLVFRIGDDRSTEKRLRVIFTPAQAP